MLKHLSALAGMGVALCGVIAPVSSVAAQTAPPLTQQVRGHGLQLKLTMSRLTYPRDALVPVTIRLTNRSTHAIDVTGNDAPECESDNGLGIEVQTKTGRLVYPPAAPWVMASCGRPIFPISVSPGASLVNHPLIVLRGSRVRAVVTVGKLGHPVRELKTPAFRVRLTPRDRPPTTFTPTGGPSLVIGPVPWQHAILHYVESGVCLHPGDGGGGTGYATWQLSSPTVHGTYDFGMPCDGTAIWSFAGGVLNHSIVREFVHT